MAHNELLLKLWKISICDSLWLWISAYLSDRLQYISVGQSVSSVLPVLSGVPQGSILGPLLFIVFVNDLPSSVLSSSIFLFADDAKCVMPVSSITDCQLFQNDLTRLVEWSTTWNLLLNEDKCSVCHLTASQFPLTHNYSISGRLLPSKSTQRDLGVIISADYQWYSHYKMIVSKAYNMLGMLHRLFFGYIPVSAKRSLYLSLVHSQLQYCSPLCSHLLSDIKCLEAVQRRATKFIINDKSMNYKDRLIRLGLLPLMMEFEISDIIFLVKSMKTPSTHFDIFKFIDCCNYSTRSSSSFKLRHSLSRNNTLGSFYFNRILRLWNSFLLWTSVSLCWSSNLYFATTSGTILFPISTQIIHAPTTICAPVTAALNSLSMCSSLCNLVVCVCVCISHLAAGQVPSDHQHRRSLFTPLATLFSSPTVL